jgi:hypothetical protein
VRAAVIAVVFLTSILSLNARQQTGTPDAKQPAATESSPPATDRNVEAKPALRVLLTHRKTWLASGGFTANGEIKNSHALDFTKDFHKGCPKPVMTDKRETADYAVTIDEIGLIDALTTTDKPTFQVAVYSRSVGMLYSGGTRFLKNAVKDACNAIGAK